jgi:hypothetical protein
MSIENMELFLSCWTVAMLIIVIGCEIYQRVRK